jgi:arsenate reductase (thioredoxin)
MAEGLLRDLAGDHFEVFSAGTGATRVRREAISVMAEIGMDLSAQESKTLERYLGEPFDLVITVCDDANEACPVSSPEQESVCTGPSPTPRADGERRLAAFRQVRDQIRSRIEDELIDAAD